MQDSYKDTKLIISFVIVFVLVAGIIGYLMVQSDPEDKTSEVSLSTDMDTPNASEANTETPKIIKTNTSQTMQPQTALERGQAFLAENSKQSGVVTLPSGLQYKIITAGTGPKPTASQTVKVHYEGTLIDGTIFDSSYKRGEPIEFPVTGVISGWVEALQLMPVGSTWMLYIPSDLAYGPRGAGGAIGPNETLIFKVELLSVR